MRKVLFVLLFVVLAVVMPAPAFMQDLPFTRSACANGVDLTGQIVSLYHIANRNDQDDIFPALQAGYADAAEYFNAHGGMCGATMAQVYDNKYVASNQDIYKRFVQLDPKPLAVTLYSSGDSAQLAPQLAKDEIPGLLLRGGSLESVYGEDGQTPGWVFATNPLYVDQVGSVCDYIVAHPERFPKPVIGFVSNDDSWAKHVVEGSHPYCESLGIGYAGVGYFSDDTVTLAGVKKLIDAGANTLYTNFLRGGPTGLTATLANMNLQDKIAVAAVNGAMDADIYFLGDRSVGSDKLPYTNGMIGSLPLRSWAEVDNPGIQMITQQADLHKRPFTMHDNAYVMGWAASDLFIETYIETGNRVGFEHITGADIKETLEKIVYAPLGGVEQIDYQGGTRRALAANRIGEFHYLGKDGKNAADANNPPIINGIFMTPWIVPLTDYQPAPDLRPGGANVVEATPAT
ncbi:MAG: ABC transporter substrate-binding protein [Anaerolineae bacterium]|nr:ABC transporter substrate-binding protein [Anaerolineae bacterium]